MITMYYTVYSTCAQCLQSYQLAIVILEVDAPDSVGYQLKTNLLLRIKSWTHEVILALGIIAEKYDERKTDVHNLRGFGKDIW